MRRLLFFKKAFPPLGKAFNGEPVHNVTGSHWHKREALAARLSEPPITSLPLFKLINCTPVRLQINERDGAIVFSPGLLEEDISPIFREDRDANKINLKCIHPTATLPDQRRRSFHRSTFLKFAGPFGGEGGSLRSF